MVAGHHLGFTVAAGQDHRNSGHKLAQGCQSLPTVHAGHRQIAQNATDFVPMLPPQLYPSPFTSFSGTVHTIWHSPIASLSALNCSSKSDTRDPTAFRSPALPACSIAQATVRKASPATTALAPLILWACCSTRQASPTARWFFNCVIWPGISSKKPST